MDNTERLLRFLDLIFLDRYLFTGLLKPLCGPSFSNGATVILLRTYLLFMLQGEVALRLGQLARVSHSCRGRACESNVQLRLLQGKLVLIRSKLLLGVHLAIVLLGHHLLLPIHRGHVAIHVLDLGPLHPLREAGLL